MKFHPFFLFVIIFLCGAFAGSAQVNNLAQSQIDSVVGQVTNSTFESFAGGISGDGRFVVFESTGNLATENARNADGNREIFLFDYAQRRIFQITNTLSLRADTTAALSQANTRVLIVNLRPTISNDGRFIAFGSNATTATPTAPNTTNPGNFDAESFNPVAPSTLANPLVSDGNTEIWLYQIPAPPAAVLSAGAEVPFADLSAGTFTRVTNTLPSRLPAAGTVSLLPVIADDNRDASISDDGNFTAFVSNRDLRPDATFGNAAPNNNDEIFTFVRNTAATNQITVTARGSAVAPLYNQNPTISGNGTRVAFLGNTNNPVRLMTGGSNTDANVEIFYADLAGGTADVTATSVKRQVTTTARVNAGDIVNVLDLGRRMSRDGRYIAFDSYADLTNENGGANYASFALYLFDSTVASPANPFRRITARSDADTTVAGSGGDVPHYPGFTDADANGAAQTLVFETRNNIDQTGAIIGGNDSGLNPNQTRPAQIYAYPLNVAASAANYKRLTQFPSSNVFIASTQPLPSNSVRRMAFNLGLTEVGTGNADLQSEAFYFLLPTAVADVTTATLSYATGASRRTVSASPVPTPTATPTPSPSPSVSPTPVTPAAVQGVSPGSLAILNFTAAGAPTITQRTAVGSLTRSFTLPIELSGVTVSINNAAAGLQSVRDGEIAFVVPPGLPTVANSASVYPIVVNNNGAVYEGSITIVPARPDVFTTALVPAPGGRALIRNATNTVLQSEPFTVTTRRIKGGRRTATVLRVFLTGVNNLPATNLTVRVRDVTITNTGLTSGAVLRAPGVYSIDFPLPASLLGAGDVPIIVSATIGTTTYESRLDDTAPRFRIL